MSTTVITTSSFSLTIDGHQAQVAPGETVLHAARKLGIDIPTLCYLEKCGPLNSCLVCLVKINGKLVPSCGIAAQPGMVVESETTEVHEARRTALELLFSDHVGDCLSPCQRLCPLRMNIPVMIRQLQTQQLDDAVHTVRNSLPLPGVLGRSLPRIAPLPMKPPASAKWSDSWQTTISVCTAMNQAGRRKTRRSPICRGARSPPANRW